MRISRCFLAFGLAAFALVPAAWAQPRPYIGFAYPAGAQQGTTVQIRLGGQNLDGASDITVSGPGVSAKVAECLRRLNNQEVQLLREQLRELKRGKPAGDAGPTMVMMSDDSAMMMSAAAGSGAKPGGNVRPGNKTQTLTAKVEQRVEEYVQTPACASIASLVVVEVTIDPDAEPGDRELRVVTPRGVSNPLVFQIGQLPEISRKPMLTANLQVLGKESSALRQRPPGEIEQVITLPCTVNGQIASGEVNKYRFAARKGQRLVLSTQARHLVPFIADAVPGWFQPVLALYDDKGKEVAFADDYRFKPDPVILYEVPRDGEYTFVIYDSIYRGREDFVYRVSVGELPFVTSIFPLGARQGTEPAVTIAGWNLDRTEIKPGADAQPGIRSVAASGHKLVSNRLPFEIGTLPELTEKEPNNTTARAQKVQLPVTINGRMNKKDDWDVYQIQGKAGQKLTAEVSARRLDSPLDSILKLTDATGTLLAFNDDREDHAAGINTHPADSAFTATFPADGAYYVHIGDTARQGGDPYGYRLHLREPQPGFDLRVTPSSFAMRGKSTTAVTVQLFRKDGFTGPVKVMLKDAPEGFIANPLTMQGTQTVARLSIRTTLAATQAPVALTVAGTAMVEGQEITRTALPVEDRMQAFLWRHLVPAADLLALVYDPSYEPPPARIPPPVPVLASQTNNTAVASPNDPKKPVFTKQQIAGRLRQLKLLFEEGLLTDEFYALRVAECNAAQ